MEIEGVIIKDLGKRAGTSERGNWMIASYVIETVEQYPKKICFEVSGEDRIRRFNIIQGRRYKVYFDIASQESANGAWFTHVRAFDVREIATPTII